MQGLRWACISKVASLRRLWLLAKATQRLCKHYCRSDVRWQHLIQVDALLCLDTSSAAGSGTARIETAGTVQQHNLSAKLSCQRQCKVKRVSFHGIMFCTQLRPSTRVPLRGSSYCARQCCKAYNKRRLFFVSNVWVFFWHVFWFAVDFF